MSEVRGEQMGASFVASGDLSGHQFKLVGFVGNDCILPATSGTICAGVLQNKPKNDEHAAVVAFGYTKLRPGGNLAGGAEFMVGGSGFAVAVTSGNWSHGYLLTAGNSGDIVEAVITPGYRVAS